MMSEYMQNPVEPFPFSLTTPRSASGGQSEQQLQAATNLDCTLNPCFCPLSVLVVCGIAEDGDHMRETVSSIGPFLRGKGWPFFLIGGNLVTFEMPSGLPRQRALA